MKSLPISEIVSVNLLFSLENGVGMDIVAVGQLIDALLAPQQLKHDMEFELRWISRGHGSSPSRHRRFDGSVNFSIFLGVMIYTEPSIADLAHRMENASAATHTP